MAWCCCRWRTEARASRSDRTPGAGRIFWACTEWRRANGAWITDAQTVGAQTVGARTVGRRSGRLQIVKSASRELRPRDAETVLVLSDRAPAHRCNPDPARLRMASPRRSFSRTGLRRDRSDAGLLSRCG